MNRLSNWPQQMRQYWQSTSQGKRLMLLTVGGLTMAVVLGIAYWASQPDYRVLFAGLPEDEVSAIAAKLQNQGVAYRVVGGGTTIQVPAEQVGPLRVSLSADGLGSKGIKGLEIFDQSALGMTPFTQNINLIRGLQGELARSIMQIEPVMSARVIISKPDPSPFIREQKPTTASVVLKLKPGTTLGRKAGAGILALVARSVDGLTRDHVTLMDTQGRVLSEDAGSENGPIGSAMDYKRDLENYLSNQAETMLASVVGQGRVLVRVTADVNFQRHREKKELYTPEGRVASKEIIKTSKKNTNAGGSTKGGPAGTASNLGKGAAGGSGSGTNDSDETIETNYAMSKITQELEDKMGAIERLTVAALVDLSSVDKDGKSASPMSLADVQEIIKQAVGFKKGRDDIKVTEVKLQGTIPPPADDEGADNMQKWQIIVNLVKNASLGIAALSAFVMGWTILRRLKPGRNNQSLPLADKNPALEKLSSTAKRDPQVIAQILARWLDQAEQSRRRAA